MISNVENSSAANVSAYNSAQNVKGNESEGVKKNKVNGRTIGEPQLTDKAAKYYEELQQKYGNMDFILVSSDMKEMAKANAGAYANPNKMVVLIDEEKIEKMAEDEDFRKQYEAVISNAASNMSALKSKLSTNSKVKGFGMQVKDDGMASFFAVIDKSQATQKERIEKKRSERKAEAKEEAKKAREERLENKRTGNKDKAHETEDDTVVITANSIEELLDKIDEYTYMEMSDNTETEAEKWVGHRFDYRM